MEQITLNRGVLQKLVDFSRKALDEANGACANMGQAMEAEIEEIGVGIEKANRSLSDLERMIEEAEERKEAEQHRLGELFRGYGQVTRSRDLLKQFHRACNDLAGGRDILLLDETGRSSRTLRKPTETALGTAPSAERRRPTPAIPLRPAAAPSTSGSPRPARASARLSRGGLRGASASPETFAKLDKIQVLYSIVGHLKGSGGKEANALTDELVGQAIDVAFKQFDYGKPMAKDLIDFLNQAENRMQAIFGKDLCQKISKSLAAKCAS